MSVYDVTYETIGHTYPVIYTAAEMGEYSPSKKGMKLERNFSFTLSSISTENHWETRTWSYKIDIVSHSLTWR